MIRPPERKAISVHWLGQIGIFAAIIAGFWLFDRLMLWMEAKGWIYWRRKKRRPSGTLSSIELFAPFDPKLRHVIEARRQAQEQRSEEEDQKGGQAGEMIPPTEHPPSDD